MPAASRKEEEKVKLLYSDTDVQGSGLLTQQSCGVVLTASGRQWTREVMITSLRRWPNGVILKSWQRYFSMFVLFVSMAIPACIILRGWLSLSLFFNLSHTDSPLISFPVN